MQTSHVLFLNLLDEFKKKMKNSEEKKCLWGRTLKNWYCTEPCDPLFADSYQSFRMEWEHFWAHRNYKYFCYFAIFNDRFTLKESWGCGCSGGQRTRNLQVWLRCVQFLVFFCCCNFRRKICTKGWLWVGGGGGGAVPSGVRTNPPNQVILPPSSFFLKSPRICFRGLQRWWELSLQTKAKN